MMKNYRQEDYTTSDCVMSPLWEGFIAGAMYLDGSSGNVGVQPEVNKLIKPQPIYVDKQWDYNTGSMIPGVATPLRC